jgi:5-formyltetrahydrofolate cyclo-ligase
MDIREEKQRHRNAIKERFTRMTPTDFAAESRTLCKQILKALPPEPGTACAYFPITHEADIRMAMEEMLKRGWKLYLPCVEDNRLTFKRVERIDTLAKGPLNIPEPAKDAGIVDLKTIDLVLLPGRVFDRQGGRLGRGNGGYDKWLLKLKQENDHVAVWGVALEMQLAHEVPMEAHDVRIDALITARGLVPRIMNN